MMMTTMVIAIASSITTKHAEDETDKGKEKQVELRTKTSLSPKAAARRSSAGAKTRVV
jgi:hypothetical protein